MDSAFTWSWQRCHVWLSSGSWKSLPSIWGECVPCSLRDIPPTQRFNPVPTVCKSWIWLKHSYFNKIGITSTREMGRSVVKKAGIKVLEMLFSLVQVPFGYLSAEIVNLKWGREVRRTFCVNKCRLALFHWDLLSTLFSWAFLQLSPTTTAVVQVVFMFFCL